MGVKEWLFGTSKEDVVCNKVVKEGKVKPKWKLISKYKNINELEEGFYSIKLQDLEQEIFYKHRKEITDSDVGGTGTFLLLLRDKSKIRYLAKKISY